jgi:hypothetical protein
MNNSVKTVKWAMRTIIIILFLFNVVTVNAEMVMWVDEDGVKNFSNSGAPRNQSIEIKTEREQKTYDSQKAQQTIQEFEELKELKRQESLEREAQRVEEEEHILQQKIIELEQEQIKVKAERSLAKKIEMEERRLKEKRDYYRSDYKNISSTKGHRDFGKKKEAQIEQKLKLLKDDPDYYFYVESTKQKANKADQGRWNADRAEEKAKRVADQTRWDADKARRDADWAEKKAKTGVYGVPQQSLERKAKYSNERAERAERDAKAAESKKTFGW